MKREACKPIFSPLGASPYNLKRRSLHGGAIKIISQVVDFLLAAISTMVLARLLSPADFGLVGMVAAVFGLADPLRNMGLTLATIQRKHVTQEQISALFWINCGFGFLLSCLAALLSLPIAWFYREPRLLPVALTLSISFLGESFGYQHAAVLNRNMQFGRIALAQLTARMFSVMFGIAMAFGGFGYWSLVYMNISASLLHSIALWTVSGWRPGPMIRGVGSRSFLHFGILISAGSLADSLSRRADKILIGHCCGAEVLGLYGKAYQFLKNG